MRRRDKIRERFLGPKRLFNEDEWRLARVFQEWKRIKQNIGMMSRWINLDHVPVTLTLFGRPEKEACPSGWPLKTDPPLLLGYD